LTRALSYAFSESIASLKRARQSAAMSIGTITIAFLTLASFLLLSANLQRVVERWASAAEMSVYLRDEVDDAAREALVAEIAGHRGIEAVEFVSRTQALERFKVDFPELADVTASAENPFPASLEVRLSPDPASAGAADAMAVSLRERPGVADVRYDGQWLTRLVGVITAIRLAGFVVAAVLVLGAAFTVAAVVRLSLEARHDELDIMQLVGAPFTFIRGPFIAEGALLGGVGATAALVALWVLYRAFRNRLSEAVAGFANVGELHFLGASDALMVLVAGCLVGALAGFVASRVAR
jgi:cell division transport system permease protein